MQVARGGCGFAGLGSFAKEEAALINHSTQSPAGVWVASPGHTMGQCKVECSLCGLQQVWPGNELGAAVGLGGLFVGDAVLPVLESSRGGGSTRQ